MTPQKQKLMSTLARLGLTPEHPGYDEPLPLVSLEEFFEGNDDPESIAVNLLSSDPGINAHPGLRDLYERLKAIRSRPDVQDVLVEVFEIETALADDATWPYAEKVFFFTSASKDEVDGWCATLRTDGGIVGWPAGAKANAPALRPGFEVWYTVWD